MIYYGIIGFICMAVFATIEGNVVRDINNELDNPNRDAWEKTAWILSYLCGLTALMWFWPFYISWIIHDFVSRTRA